MEVGEEYYIYYIERSEFNKHKYTGTKVDFDRRNKYLKLETNRVFSPSSVSGYLKAQNDTMVIGIAVAHYPHGPWKRLKYSELRGRSYFDSFIAKNPGVFTFNGVIYYHITDIREQPNGDAEYFLSRIDAPLVLEPNTAFMIMPFRLARLNSLYAELSGTLAKNGIKIVRANQIIHNDVISDIIYQAIENAEFIICEITYCNKNVFYEVGYAKGINKQIIFISQKLNRDLKFFDVAHIKRIEYHLSDLPKFFNELLSTIQAIKLKY